MRKTLVILGLPILILLGFASGILSYDECVAPPFIASDAPPLVMLVMERDHKLYYQAYNDATDLDGDGKLDVGYKDAINYSGYFDSDKCYTYDSGTSPARFIPSRFAPNAYADSPNHYCGAANEWSGNFLNWLSMSRMDTVKRVLYGGHRSTDTTSETVLEGVYIPQDAHSWGKEYAAPDTRQLTPFAAPTSSSLKHLFCVTSDSDGDAHKIKVALNDSHRVWEWSARENPVCMGPSFSTSSDQKVAYRSDITSYYVRVKACALSPDLDTTFCKHYPSGGTTYKPIGLVQRYAEGTGSKLCSKSWTTCTTDANCASGQGLCIDNTGMYLGMITGSYTKNTSGGVLRKNIWSVLDEINASTGQWLTSSPTEGNIISTMDLLKTVGFNYSSHSYSGVSGETCGWIEDHVLQEGQCRMWGNPIGEMMYEALRYFAGKGSPTSAFTYSGTTDSTLNLPKPSWGMVSGSKTYQPYDIFPSCARPYLLVISDVNVNYDSDQLPGSSFSTVSGGTVTGDLPNLNVNTLANTIGTTEAVAGNTFIGQSGTTADMTCTAKNITNLGNIRGLCPEEPTKQGSFYSAAVAYYGKTMFKDNTGKPNVNTMAIALASPVPDINVKVGNYKVRVVPVGKSVSGCYSVRTNCFDKCSGSYNDSNGLHLTNCTSSAFCPSNQIVNVFVDTITYDSQNNITYASFRINFEDSEQGADHDMDSIVQYTIQPVGSNQISVTVDASVYGVGCIDQVLGFVISGTSEDGAYFVVKDADVGGTNTDTPSTVSGLPLTWTKTFTVTGNTAGLLHDPLWYAAKWGGFTDTDGSKKPDRPKKWDRDNDGVPDNYFYVANPLQLYAQMQQAFIAILSRGGSAGAVATVTQQVQGQDMLVRGAFTSYENDPRTFVWKGHLETYWPYNGCADFTTQTDCQSYTGCTWTSSGAGGACSGLIYSFQRPENVDKFCFEHHDHCWEAEEHLPSPANRNIFTWINGQKTTFSTANLCPTDKLALQGDALYGSDNCTQGDMVNWIRGDDSYVKGRDRDGWTLGDIVYSTPVVIQQPSLSAVPAGAGGSCDTSCTGGCNCNDLTNNSCRKQCFICYRECQQTRKRVIAVGSNDGMVHAFVAGKWNDGNSTWIIDPAADADIGKELWAYVPSNILTKLKELARPSYGCEGGCVHRFMVDLSPQAWEVYIDPDGAGSQPRQWRTVLIGGERGGGDDFFALDVTDVDNPTILWEYPAFRNMVQMSGATSPYTVVTPYRRTGAYGQVKALPSSWAVPYVGKLKLPTGISFLAASPVAPLDGNSTISPSTYDNTSLSGWLAVVPTAPRIFQTSDLPASLTNPQKLATFRPNLLMIDIEKGVNIFQYLWPLLLATQAAQWPDKLNGTNTIPYAPGSALVLDIWNASGKAGTDGYMDHIYFGDLNGKFYGIRFNMEDTNKGMEVDFWQTKGISSPDNATDILRSDHEPISVMPAATLDRDNHVHLYFGTGKYDTIRDANNDQSDATTMSLYMLEDNSTRPTINASATVSGTGPISVSGASAGFVWNNFGVDVNSPHCNNPVPTFSSTCTWVKADGTPDCCESSNTSCATPCWKCIESLNVDGERVIDSALVAGGLVFFTTFVPSSDPCTSGGYAYLYAVDYLCRDLGSTDPLAHSGFSKQTTFSFQSLAAGQYGMVQSGTKTVGVVAKIGVGMPSRPVLDSSSLYIFVQTSVAEIHRIKVDLPQIPLYMQGWEEED